MQLIINRSFVLIGSTLALVFVHVQCSSGERLAALVDEQKFVAFIVHENHFFVDSGDIAEDFIFNNDLASFALRRAIYEYNELYVKEILRRCSLLKVMPWKSKTPLMYAARDPLSDDDVDENKVGEVGQLLADIRRVDMMRFLIQEGVGIDVQNASGMTALMYAADAGCVGGVQELLTAGANPRLKTHKGTTALLNVMMAYRIPIANRSAIAGYLLEAGANGDAVRGRKSKRPGPVGVDWNRLVGDLLDYRLCVHVDNMIDLISIEQENN